MEKLLAHPLLDGGQMLNESAGVLVSLVGGPDLTMAEVNRIMEQINRLSENAHLIMGAAVDKEFKGRLAVTLVASGQKSLPDTIAPVNRLEASTASTEPELESQLMNPGTTVRPGFRHADTLPIDCLRPRASGEDARSPATASERRGMCAADATV